VGLALESMYLELEKVLRSRTFSRAAGQRKFLRYAVTEALEGRGHLLKEYSIGAFLRGDSFDPRVDSIVRTEARKLRARLAKYFETEGRADPLRIHLPVGKYVPVFTAASRHGYPSATPGNGRRLRIAVMPFVSRGATQRERFFSDGLTDELIHALAHIPRLEVSARTSPLRFREQHLDIREIGRRLDVNVVVEGTVRTSRNRMRIIAQLADASNGSTLWSGSYDRGTKDPFAVQQELSRTLADELGLYLRDHAPLVAVASNNGHEPSLRVPLDEEYLTGRYFARRYTLGDYESAIGCYQQSIAKEPDSARAYSDLARCQVMLPFFKAMLSSELIPDIRRSASKALEIDSSLGEAHVALAVPLIHDFDWSTAGVEFRKGLELSPSDLVGRAWYGTYLLNIGRGKEGLAEHKKVAELDPTSPLAAHNYGLALYLSRHYDQAITQFRKALSRNSSHAASHAGLGAACVHKGSYTRGIAEMETAEKLTPGLGRVRAELAYAYAVSGNREKAKEILNEFLDWFDPDSFPALMIATVYIGLGDKRRAFEWLHKAIDQKDLAVFLKSDPLYDPLRSDARFAALLKRTNLS
jgi:TolB-like protein/tetratricopeptide (TPR) repeat protein